jgi:hypothetical protein
MFRYGTDLITYLTVTLVPETERQVLGSPSTEEEIRSRETR